MDPAAEGQVWLAVSRDVEPVGVLERSRVAVSGAEDQDQGLACAQHSSVQLVIHEDPPESRLHRRVLPQQFVDGGRDESGVLAQPRELPRVAQQGQHPVPDEVGGRLVPAHE